MVLLFRHSYELRAEKAAEGGAKVVVVGPPGAGKTTFIKQFLEPRGVVAAEETAGLAPEAEEARGGGLRERGQRLLKRIFARRYVSGREAAEELKDIKGADHLKAFDELPRDFVEYLKKRYHGWSLYLFYIPPEVEEEREAVEDLLKIAKRVGVEFRWFGLRYVPPGVVAMLKERGGGYVEEQLRLYRRILEEFDAAGGRLAKLGKSVAEKTGESLLERFAEAAEELAKLLLPPLPGGVAAGAVLGIASYFLAGGGEWSRWIRLLADWSRLDSRLRDLAAAHIALSLGLDRDRVREVLDGLAAAGERLKALKSDFSRLLDEVKRLALKAAALEHGVAVYFLHDVESRDLYINFYVKDRPYLESREPSGLVAVPLVEGGRFGELTAEALRRLEEEGALVLVGPKGVGKSTLAAYVIWRALREGRAYGVVKVAGGVGTEAVLRALADVAGAELIALYDPSPTEVYYDPDYVKLTKVQQVSETLKELGALAAVERRVKILAVLPSDLYDAVLKKAEKSASKLLEKMLEVDLRDVKFLADVIYEYSKCREAQRGEAERLAEKIAEFNGGYTLVAKYAGLWLRDNGCKVESVERAVEEAKSQPKLFLANYIWHVLLRGNGDLARRVAVPLLLHARFGPVPIGVTYITKAVKNGVWRFLKPEELEGASLESLREDELEPIARWLAQQHEDLVEETLRDLAGLNGEEARKPYREALSDLIKALDWARDEALKEGSKILAEFGIPMETLKVHSKILAELGVPEEEWELWTALLAFVNQRLAAVFKRGESRRCWKRAAFIAGHALAGYLVLLTTKPPEHVAEALGDALKPCDVDDYLTIDGKIPWLSICIAQLMPIRELNILSPYTDVEIIKAAKKTAEELMKQWRRRGFSLTEVIYALGLATLAAGAEVDGETVDRLLHAASATVQLVTHPMAVLPVLAALRPLGEKAPHRYIVTLAAASELETLDHETVEYIYDALQQLRDRLLEAGRLWPLVEAVRAYSNMVRKHLMRIKHLQKNAVAKMCQLYGEVRKRNAAVAPESGLSAHRLFDAIARACVLAVVLESDDLVRHVRKHCGLGDLEREAEAVRNVLDDATAHPEELRKIMENDADFAEWVTARNVAGDAGLLIEDLRACLTYELARYKLDHAIDEKGELDAEKLEEVAEEFEKAAEISRKLKLWENYLTARGWALRARVLAAESWEELLERAKGFWELWREAEKYPKPTTGYFKAANLTLGQCLVYLAVSGNKAETVKLLKEWRWLLDYDPEVSVVTRLMIKLFSVGEGARLKDVVDVFGPWLPPEFWPTLLMLTGRLQKEEALELCKKLPKSEVCVDAVVSVAGDQEAAEKSKLEIKSETPKTRPLRNEVDGRTLVEALATTYSHARLAFMLLAAVEGRGAAVRLHGLLGSVAYVDNVNQPLFRAVYENCGDLNSEGCRMALLKLYYYHF